MKEDESKNEDSDNENVIEVKLNDGDGQTTIELEGKESREELVVEDQNKKNVQMKKKIVDLNHDLFAVVFVEKKKNFENPNFLGHFLSGN